MKDVRDAWSDFTRDYFLHRGTLANVLLLVDASIPPIDLDVVCANWLAESEVPFTVVFTKVDKSSRRIVEKHVEAFQDRLRETWSMLPVCFATSARFGDGRDELLK